jgi:hypothetical protein
VKKMILELRKTGEYLQRRRQHPREEKKRKGRHEAYLTRCQKEMVATYI